MKLIGVDGCRYGWVAATLDEDRVQLFPGAGQLVAAYPEDSVFLIDIPVGLDSAGCVRRNCEAEARKLLAPGRKSSVFPVPCREAVFSENYSAANTANRAVLSKGLPIQSWNICNKIAEVDSLLSRSLSPRSRMRESHPELAFQLLKGAALASGKKSAGGQEERLRILEGYEPATGDIFRNSMSHHPRRQVAKDDVLDALCLAVTLKLIIQHGGFSPGHPTDENGIEMHIHVFSPPVR